MTIPAALAEINTASTTSTNRAEFGPFKLYVEERRLERDGNMVQIGSRALDLLLILVESAGETVDKREFLSRVWPGMVVEESSVRAHIAGLRKALGDGINGARYITNVPGRGYCFVAPVRRTQGGSNAQSVETEMPQRGDHAPIGLPPTLERIVGRADTLAELAERLKSRRFLSLVGAGGIGKTTVAISLANSISDRFDASPVYVDLAVVGDGTVLAALASGLGVRADDGDLASAILGVLKEQRTLLVLDGCEHVIEGAASICERIFFEAPLTSLIATSREALRVEGEFIFRLQPLELPPEGAENDVAQLSRYPAVQMFLERATAAGLEPTRGAEIAVVAHLCRQLDGLPLALELAAARASSFGISGLAELLEQRFGLHWQGRRTAHPRHQTLSAMLEWSYQLLSPDEQRLLRQLSVFRGLFSVQDVLAVALSKGEHGGDLIDILDSLVGKSLVASGGETQSRYRLLDTTRAFASVRLDESDDQVQVMRSHAQWIASKLEHSLTEGLISFYAKGSRTSIDHLGDIRSALTWSFSDKENSRLAIRLAASACHVLLSMSLLDECGKWAELGLKWSEAEDDQLVYELPLQAAFAVSLAFGADDHNVIRSAIARGLEIAISHSDHSHQMWLLAGLHLLEVRTGNVSKMLEVAEKAQILSTQSGDAQMRQLAEWMLGMSHHLAGRQNIALSLCDPVVSSPGKLQPSLLLFGIDQRIRAIIIRMRALWLAGFPDQAIKLAHTAVSEGAQSKSSVTHCLSLIYASTVFLWAGEWAAAETTINSLTDQTSRHGLAHYKRIAACMEGELWIRRGDIHDGVIRLEEQLKMLASEKQEILFWGFTNALAEGYALSSRPEQALSLISEALASYSSGTDRFDMPELLRIKAMLLYQCDTNLLSDAHDLLWNAIALAKQQTSLSWMLRCATSLMKLPLSPKQRIAASDLIANSLATFSEGFFSLDYRRAKETLDSMVS